MEAKNFKIRELGAVTSGVSQKDGKTWKRREVWLEETKRAYPDSVCATLFNERVDRFDFAAGDTINAEVDLVAEEYNGRWYNHAFLRNFESVIL